MICSLIGGDVITATSVGMSQHHQTPVEWIYVKWFDVIGFRWYNDDSVIPYTSVNISLYLFTAIVMETVNCQHIV